MEKKPLTNKEQHCLIMVRNVLFDFPCFVFERIVSFAMIYGL